MVDLSYKIPFGFIIKCTVWKQVITRLHCCMRSPTKIREPNRYFDKSSHSQHHLAHLFWEGRS